MAGGVIVVVVALARLRVLVLPMIVALLLSTVLVPPVRRIQRTGVPRILATWLVLLGCVGAVVGVLVLIAPSVVGEFRDLVPTAQAGVDQVENWLVDGPLQMSRAEIDRYSDQILEQVRSSGDRVISGVLAGAALASEVAAGVLLTLVLLFFFVKDGEKICGFGLRQVRPEHQDLARALGRRLWAAVGGYMRGTAAVAMVDATIISLGLVLIGVPLVLPLGVLTFFGAFFPLVGAVFAGIVAVLVALVSGGPTDALLTLGVVLVVQQIEGNVLAPMVLGRAVRLHPVVIIMALSSGAIVGGLIGAFLAVPTTAVAVAVATELRDRGVIGPRSTTETEPTEVVVHMGEPAGDPTEPADGSAEDPGSVVTT